MDVFILFIKALWLKVDNGLYLFASRFKVVHDTKQAIESYILFLTKEMEASF